MGLESVGDLALNTILLNLGPKDTAKVACLSKRFNASASEECLWSKYCSDDLDLDSPIDPLGNPVPSFKIRASAVFVPELADLESDSENYVFAYSIRMSLLPEEGCIINGMTFNSCQLQRRHWIIRANNVVVSDVSGKAVIGMYPLLRPGEKEFFYQSCTPLPATPGSVKGSFTFVPGRLADPKGSPFEVEVAEFLLQQPDYIY